MIATDVIVEDERWTGVGEVEPLAARAVAAALAAADYGPETSVDVAVLLTSDAAVQGLNRDWRGQDKPTNVLSFPAAPEGHAPGPRPLGDLALAYETLAREAEADGKSLRDHALHLIVHGTLHLFGYDHETDAEAEIMEGLEIESLARLGVANPYRDVAF